MESWVPRRPSARLKERIFAESNRQTAAANVTVLDGLELFANVHRWVKFTPAFCMLLMVMLLGIGRQNKTGYLAVAGGSNVLASLSSNMLALCATDMRDQHENVLSAVNFDWTKTAHYLTTTGSLQSLKTNVHKL